MSSYVVIISLSVCVVMSYVFNEISKRTNIPSVLMLIITGVGLGQYIRMNPEYGLNFFPILEILGVVGLIMIVLEGALDLELSKEKRPLILKATLVALLGILTSIAAIGGLFHFVMDMDLGKSLLYAAPLSVISSAIVIPSIASLKEYDKEFLVYESCISDILGIMFFYLIVATLETGQIGASLGEFSVQLLITLFASLIVGIAMILFFKFLDAKVKLFFFIAILILMYEIFKLSHLSPLFLILIFGLILKNPNLFFRGKLSGIITRMEFIKMERDFHIVTRETAFILRTFFFIIFGLTIELQSLFSLDVLLLSLMAFILILILRILLVNGLARQASNVVTYVAPRGLITILLFYSIPGALESAIFKPSIVLWVVLITSLFMSFGLIRNGRKENEDEVSPEPDVG